MNTKRILIIISLIFYAASMFFPAFDCGEGHRASFKGYEVLLNGWLGIIALEPRWYVNAFYLYVVIRILANEKYTPHSFVMVFMLLAAFTSPIVPGWVSCPAMDTMTSAKGLAFGGYLWVCSILLVSSLAFFNSSEADVRIEYETENESFERER